LDFSQDVPTLAIAAKAGVVTTTLAASDTPPEDEKSLPSVAEPPEETPIAGSGTGELPDVEHHLAPLRHDEARVMVITEAEGPNIDRSSWVSYLQLLGGIEIAGLYGFARVSSSINDDVGNSVEVAAGEARQVGYRIALYSAPKITGLFWYPTVGYLSQKVALADFRHSLEKTSMPDSQEVAVVCSDPQTGATIDCNAPNIYSLDLTSGYGGLRAGYDFVVGNPMFRFFTSANIGVNVVEYRRLRAKVGNYDATGSRWDWVHSGAVGATIGFTFPSAHLATRFIFDWEWYRDFKYAEALQFDGPVTTQYVESKGQTIAVPQESAVKVKAAGFYSYCLQLAVAYVF